MLNFLMPTSLKRPHDLVEIRNGKSPERTRGTYVRPFLQEAEDDGDSCGADERGTDHKPAMKLKPRTLTCHREYKENEGFNSKCGQYRSTSYRNEDLPGCLCRIKFVWYWTIFFNKV